MLYPTFDFLINLLQNQNILGINLGIESLRVNCFSFRTMCNPNRKLYFAIPGREKLSSMPVGGAVPAGAPAAPAGGAAAPAEEKKGRFMIFKA